MNSRHAFPVFALALSLGAGCTGVIGGDGPDDGAPGPGDTPGGSVGAPGGGGSTEPPDMSPFYGPIVSSPSSATRFVRLNHVQYENTVRDVLRLSTPLGLSNAFVAEPLLTTFTTNGSVLTVPPDLRLDYQTAAETLGATVAHDPQLLSEFAPGSEDVATRVKSFIETFGQRVFRRPLTAQEVARYQALFDQGPTLIGSGDAFADGVELVVSALFQSPHFLYRTELSSTVVDGKVPLSGYEVASRLSYALTNSMPDDQLFQAAAGGLLATRDGVLAEAARLLATPAGIETVRDFHEQLLVMREYETISKDEDAYPEFGDGVAEDLKQEALTFAEHVIYEEKAGLSQLLTAPYTFANGRIRQIYGVSGNGADDTTFTKLALDPTQRAGMLTQVGFLAAHGEQGTPNIIMRGVHIVKRVLCLDLPAPPDNVPALPPLEKDSTNRQRVEELTSPVACAGCHQQIINPMGFGLEAFDGVGRYRTTDNGFPVDASGTYSLDGQQFTFNGPVDMIGKIAASYQAHSCYSKNWVEYLYGRTVDAVADADLINQAGRLSRTTESVQDLILQLLATEAFTSRLP